MPKLTLEYRFLPFLEGPLFARRAIFKPDACLFFLCLFLSFPFFLIVHLEHTGKAGRACNSDMHVKEHEGRKCLNFGFDRLFFILYCILFVATCLMSVVALSISTSNWHLGQERRKSDVQHGWNNKIWVWYVFFCAFRLWLYPFGASVPKIATCHTSTISTSPSCPEKKKDRHALEYMNCIYFISLHMIEVWLLHWLTKVYRCFSIFYKLSRSVAGTDWGQKNCWDFDMLFFG